MKIFIVEYKFGNHIKLETVVQDNDVLHMANMLESHPDVKNFHIDKMNVINQQKEYGATDFKKWISPICVY